MNIRAERTKENNDEHDGTLYSKYKESKQQMNSHAASETNERKTDCHQIFIFFSKV